MHEHLYKLFCMVENNSIPFSVDTSADDTVDDLKKIIKSEKPNALQSIDANQLMLWKVDKPRQEIKTDELTDDKILDPTWSISDYWDQEPPTKRVHVFIRIAGK